MLTKNNRELYTDYVFDSDCKNEKYDNMLFLRLVAKNKRFQNIDFKYSIFDTSYLRNCVFDSCDFTGCRFISANLYGSSFCGCKFDYATFERTIIDSDILNNECPSWENLKLKFARSLRMNFQQIGDIKSVNKAIKIELDATGIYLYKAWASNESYYRKKYKKWERIQMFFEWLNFKVLDNVWGNGESAYKLIKTSALLLLFMSIIDFVCFNKTHVRYLTSILKMPSIFLGIEAPVNYPKSYLSLLTFIRLVIMGFFMSIIVKRFNRR